MPTCPLLHVGKENFSLMQMPFKTTRPCSVAGFASYVLDNFFPTVIVSSHMLEVISMIKRLTSSVKRQIPTNMSVGNTVTEYSFLSPISVNF